MTDSAYRYNCPGCNNIALDLNNSTCPHCQMALVWSGNPEDQPRQHPQESGRGGEGLGFATLYAMAGEPIVENEAKVPVIEEVRAVEGTRFDVHHGVIANEQPADREKFSDDVQPETATARLSLAEPTPGARALPPGEQAVPPGVQVEIMGTPLPPGERHPASVASGVQNEAAHSFDESEAPAPASDKPDSLPGESKPPITEAEVREITGLPSPPEGQEKPVPRQPEPDNERETIGLPGEGKKTPEVPEFEEDLVGLPSPPEGQEKPVPELLKAVDLTGARPTLPDDPDPVAPLSGLRASEIAEIAHTANSAYRTILGDDAGPGWLDMDPAEQASVIAGVRAVLVGTVVAPALSHKAWYDRKFSEGWMYGPVKDVEAHQHPNMIAAGVWGDLPDHERRKDLLFLGIVVSLIRAV